MQPTEKLFVYEPTPSVPPPPMGWRRRVALVLCLMYVAVFILGGAIYMLIIRPVLNDAIRGPSTFIAGLVLLLFLIILLLFLLAMPFSKPAPPKT